MGRRSFVTSFTSNSGIVIAQGETDTVVAGLFVAATVRAFCDYRARLLHECKAGCGCIGASSLSLPIRTYLGSISDPCCMREPTVSHMEFFKSKLFSNSSGSGLHGCGLSHSPGAIL